MTEPGGIDSPLAGSPRPRSMAFRKRRNFPLLTREQSRRQSNLIQSAWRHFGEAPPMIAFLNTRNAALDGQPLQLAIQSDDGLERVEQLIKKLEETSAEDEAIDAAVRRSIKQSGA